MNRTLASYRFFTTCIIFLLISSLHAQTFVTNGSASSMGGGCYQLTPDQPTQAGTIFSAAPINLNQPFNLSARYNFGCKDANGADGIVFIFATTNTAVGGGGGSLGYEGITPSIAIEVDDYQNSNFGDPVADHMAIISMGSVNHNAPTNLVGPITIPNVEDCNDHCFTVSWNPATQTLSALLDGNFISYTGNIIGNIFGGNPNVYYGFSSATGSLSNLHTVCVGPPQLIPMQDVSVCPGQSVQLQADPNGMQWFWAPNPTLSAINIANPVATPLVTTTYSVTITYTCGGTHTDDVTVTVLPPPPATASSNSPICAGQTLQLNASGGVSYSWSGPLFFSSNQQNPSLTNVGLPNAGTYTVTVTDANGCTNTASTNVIIFPAPVVAIAPPPLPFCENAPIQTLQAVPPGGTWGGAANAQGQINPAALGPGQHQVTYTATDPNGCVGTDNIFVQIVPVPNVQIVPSGPYCRNDPVQTLLGTPGGGIWGGAANIQGQIFPAALGPGTHTVTYQVIDGFGCQATVSYNVIILPGTTVNIVPAGPFCPGAGPQVLSAVPPGGTWGGAANPLGQVDPAALGPGQHLVTYDFNQPGSCPGSDIFLLDILNPPTANISGGGILCEGSGATVPLTLTVSGSGPLSLTYTINNGAPTTITVSPGTTTLPAGQPGSYTIVSVVDANGCTGTGSGSALVQQVGAPQVSNFSITCDPTNTNYTVTFEITGGDPASYAVTGSAGTLTAAAPYIFTSAPIVAGTSYSFLLNDANNCAPTTLSGNFTCQCATDAGTMSLVPLAVCLGETITATHNGDEVLDGNDNLVFMLHSSNGNSLGTVFAVNNTPTFGLVPPMQPGITYYISAVAGDGDGSGGVDLNDPCLSVAFGTPVVFRPLPTVMLQEDAEICAGETAALTFALTGNAPFDVTYSDGSQQFTFDNILNGHNIQVSPPQTTTFSIVSVADNSTPACSTQGGNSVTVTVWQPTLENRTAAICDGDNILLGGALQTTAGMYADTLATIHGCDSIILTTLTVHALDTTQLSNASCNPANVGTTVQVLTNINGCDSVVILTTIYSETDTVLVTSTTCDPTLAGVFTNHFVTPDGCDSTVIETVALLPSDTTHLTGTSCDPAQTGVFTQILPNQYGCDSTVVTTIAFSQFDTTWLASTTCDPTLAGTFTSSYITPDGCDSTVIETVALLPTDTTYQTGTSCDPAQTGVFTQILSNQYGCDSTVVETIALLPSDTTYLTGTSCDPAQTGVFTQILSNQYGCDSTVVESISLLPPDECGLVIALAGDTIPCTETTGALTLTITQGLPPFNYSWQSAAGGPIGNGTTMDNSIAIGNLPGGSFSVTVTSSNGLTATATALLVQVVPPGIQVSVLSDFNGFAISCHGATDGAASVSVSGGVGPFAYQWSNGVSGPSIGSLPAGSYTVTVSGPYGCTAAGSVVLSGPPPLTLAFTVNDPDCFGQKEGLIFADPSGGVLPYRFSLEGGPWQASNAYTGLDAGTYEVAVQDANGCETSEIIWINAPLPVNVELGDDLFIKFGENAVLTALVNLPFDSLSSVTWSPLDASECPGCLAQPVAPLITTAYTVTVTALNGCTDTDRMTVFVDRRKQIYIPNAFSPNGDGVNDVFMIFAKPHTVSNIRAFLVFSRWGETVHQYFNFQPNDPTYGWNGTHRGEYLNPSVFAWFAEVEFLDGQVLLFEGDVILVR